MSDSKVVHIVDGPSKFNLMIALFHTPSSGSHELLSFKLEDGRRISVILLGVEMEDGSRERWYLKGKIAGEGSFEACYGTKTREGTLSV